MPGQLRGLFVLPFLLLVSACGGGGAANPAPAPSGPPAVASTAPAAGATGVFLNSAIFATFNQAMDPATLTPATFALATGGAAIPGRVVVSGDGTTAIFTPTGAFLAPATTYTATVTTGARNGAGAPLAADFSWAFTTGTQTADPLTNPPLLLSTVPADNAAGVAVSTTISATFDRSMDPTTISSQTFTVTGGQGAVAGTVTASGAVATFKPAAPLTPNTVFTATVTIGAKDTSGIPLAANVRWSFTTATVAGAIPPAVTATVPAAAATGVFLNRTITVTFNKAMDPQTISTATFTLASGGAPVTGTVALIGTTATFRPAAALSPNTVYTATVTKGAKDAAGNPLAADFIWSFTTGATGDVTLPTVQTTVPVNNATGISVGSPISATFGKAMDPATINQFTFTLSSGIIGSTIPVQGAVALDATGTVATFTPVAPLQANTFHTATITTGAKDLAGNPLAAPFVWSFTTGAL
jgi:Bacterial Ig-like domain